MEAAWIKIRRASLNRAASTLPPLRGPVTSSLKECPRSRSFKATQSFHYCGFCLLETVSPSSAARNPQSLRPKAHGHMRGASSLCSSASLSERGVRSQPPPDRLCLQQESEKFTAWLFTDPETGMPSLLGKQVQDKSLLVQPPYHPCWLFHSEGYHFVQTIG